MNKYFVTRIREIEFQAKDDKELMKLYDEGVIDEHLSFDLDDKYLIKDENGKVIFEHTYT